MKFPPLVTRSLARRYLGTEAGPRPFPTQINIGIDIAEIKRFERIIQPSLLSEDASSAPKAAQIPENARLLDYNSTPGLSVPLRSYIRKVFNHVEWHDIQLRLFRYLHDSRSQRSQLAEYLASRWAAKEAAVKAHRYRRLHLRDVIIASMPPMHGHNVAPVVLINPPRPMVTMSDKVARQRGLSISGNEGGDSESDDSPKLRRPARIAMSERQLGRLSISHDGGYAIAVVQALDEPVIEQTLEPLIDDGTAEPMHEPFIGDKGYDRYDLAEALAGPSTTIHQST